MQTRQRKKSAECREGRQGGNNKYTQNIIKVKKSISWGIAVSGGSHNGEKQIHIKE